MANRRLAQREVTDVEIPQDSTAKGLASLADTAQGFMELEKKKDLANMNSFMANANLQMMDVTNKFKVANEADPTNRESLGKLNADYEKILGQYTNKVGVLSRGDWQQVSNKLKNQYAEDNLQWGQKQTVVNMENSVKSSIQTNLETFRKLGQSFDMAKVQQSYQNSRDLLMNSAMGIIGADKTKELLKDYHKDAMKMFIYGAAETDPYKAEVLLNQPGVKEDIENPEDEAKLRSIIEKNKGVKEEQIIQAQNKAEDDILKNYLLNSSSVDLLSVDNALKANQISPKFAESMKDMITSPKTVKGNTDFYAYEKAMNEIMNPDIKASKIREDIISLMNKGKLSQSDADRLLYTKQQGRKTSVYQDYQAETAPTTFKNHPFKFVWKAVSEYFTKDAEAAESSDRLEVMNNIIDRARNENISDPAGLAKITKSEIQKKNMQRNPYLLTIKDGGQVMMDANGNMATVYPDGSFEEIG